LPEAPPSPHSSIIYKTCTGYFRDKRHGQLRDEGPVVWVALNGAQEHPTITRSGVGGEKLSNHKEAVSGR